MGVSISHDRASVKVVAAAAPSNAAHPLALAAPKTPHQGLAAPAEAGGAPPANPAPDDEFEAVAVRRCRADLSSGPSPVSAPATPRLATPTGPPSGQAADGRAVVTITLTASHVAVGACMATASTHPDAMAAAAGAVDGACNGDALTLASPETISPTTGTPRAALAATATAASSATAAAIVIIGSAPSVGSGCSGGGGGGEASCRSPDAAAAAAAACGGLPTGKVVRSLAAAFEAAALEPPSPTILVRRRGVPTSSPTTTSRPWPWCSKPYGWLARTGAAKYVHVPYALPASLALLGWLVAVVVALAGALYGAGWAPWSQVAASPRL